MNNDDQELVFTKADNTQIQNKYTEPEIRATLSSNEDRTPSTSSI